MKPKEWPAHVIDLLTSFIVCTSEVKGVSKWMHFFISVFLQPLWHFIKALAKQSMNLCKTGVLGPVCLKISKTAVDLEDLQAEAVMTWAELASKSCLPGLFTMEVE